MRRLEVGAAAVAVTVALVSGSVRAQDAGGKPGPTASTAAQAGTTDKGFVDEMAIAGMAEVQLGKMAADHAANADVKSFGQMMVADHSKANDELKQIASKLNIQPATQLDQKHRDLADKLSKLKGAEFDREYMMAMVQGHEEVLRKLMDRAGSHTTPTATTPLGDHALTQWAAKTAPTVQRHLERAKEIQQKVAK